MIHTHEKKATATLRMVRVSPYKFNDIAKPLRQKSVDQALVLLKGMRKRSARDMEKALLSAISNAVNNFDMDPDLLVVNEMSVGKSMSLRRMDFKGRSRLGRIVKQFSQVHVVLEEKVLTKVANKRQQTQIAQDPQSEIIK